MIVVTGPPRSGTSMLMQMLAAGGLTAIVRDSTLTPKPGNLGGTWEVPAALRRPLPVVYEHRDDPDRCVKLFYESLRALLGFGILPAGVVCTDRPAASVIASQRARGLERAALAGEARVDERREATMAAAAAASVPVHVVDFAALVAAPAAGAALLAAFLQPLVGVALDEAAMAAVPDAGQVHF